MLFVGRYANAGVLHRKLDARRQPVGRQHHLASCGELQRVAQQVDQHLHHAVAVGADPLGQFGVKVAAVFKALCCSFGCQHVKGVAHRFVQVKHLGVQHEAAGLQLGIVEHVVDDGHEVVGRVSGVVKHLERFGPVMDARQQQFVKAKDGVHGGAQFVADAGNELVAHDLYVFQLFAFGFQFGLVCAFLLQRAHVEPVIDQRNDHHQQRDHNIGGQGGRCVRQPQFDALAQPFLARHHGNQQLHQQHHQHPPQAGGGPKKEKRREGQEHEPRQARRVHATREPCGQSQLQQSHAHGHLQGHRQRQAPCHGQQQTTHHGSKDQGNVDAIDPAIDEAKQDHHPHHKQRDQKHPGETAFPKRFGQMGGDALTQAFNKGIGGHERSLLPRRTWRLMVRVVSTGSMGLTITPSIPACKQRSQSSGWVLAVRPSKGICDTSARD